MEEYKLWLQKAKEDQTRYPIYEELASFGEKEAREAYDLATKVIEFVEKKIK